MQLNHDQMARFNQIVVEKWEEFIAQSPWFDDSFLTERVPVGLTVRYGQDLTICEPGTNAEQRAAWDRQRRWADLHYVSFALATHIRARHCEEVEEIPFQEVLAKINQKHWKVYDSWDETLRKEIVDLETYPCFNPDGQENRIYNDSGRRIPRVRYLSDSDNERNAGVLVDLGEIMSLFSSSGDRRDRDSSPDLQVTLYPQAYIPQMGHVKANTVVRPFRDILEEVNSNIEALWEGLEDELEEGLVAVHAVSSQFYNELSHKLAPRAGNQEVQKGDQTAAMASGYQHSSTACQNRGDRLYRRCRTALPFQRHQTLLDSQLESTPTDLRAENVYIVDMYAIPENYRTGR